MKNNKPLTGEDVINEGECDLGLKVVVLDDISSAVQGLKDSLDKDRFSNSSREYSYVEVIELIDKWFQIKEMEK
jgi:hypothetical protein